MAEHLDNYPKFKIFGRVVLFWLSFIGLFMAFSFLYSFFPPIDSKMIGMRHGITGAVVAFIVTGVFLKMEKKSFRDIGLVWEKNTLLKFLGGILAGSVLFGVMLLILLKIAGMQLLPNNKSFDYRLLVGYLAFIPLALMEEVAFRSYPFRRLTDTFGLRPSQVIVGISFALYHLIGGWSLYSAFTGPFVWSFVFGLAAARSGGIAVPTGIHIMLNVLQVLTGMKEGPDSMWKLSYVGGASKDALARTEMTGLFLQVAVLVAAIAATEYFIRRKSAGRVSRVPSMRKTN
jgi:membrane protease YdiL (CAAX protease family)